MTASFSTDSTTTTTIMARPGVQSQSQHVHKRRTSTDSDELLVTAASTSQLPSPSHHPQRTRMMSTPSGNSQHTRSVSVANNAFSRPTLQRPPGLPLLSPVRTSFHMAPPPNGTQVNGHSRARSISAFSYSPLAPSPLSASFQVNNDAFPSNSTSDSKSLAPRMQTSYSAPEIEGSSSGNDNAEPLRQQTSQSSHRPRTRMHSHNLSIFFPHPSSLPTSSISELEDGTQEVLIPDPSQVDEASGRSTESSGSSAVNKRTDRMSKPLTPLGQGFTFGLKPPPTLGMGYPSTNTSQRHQLPPTSPPITVTRTRRGHHHKHSRSHNFFSFLEPGSTSVSPDGSRTSPGSDTTEPELHTQSIPVPVSSWETKVNPGQISLASYNNGHDCDSLPHDPVPLVVSPTFAKILSITNLCLGATLWVRGQQAGSLACTGLGYWVVFDAIGLALSRNFDFGLGSIASRLGGMLTQHNLMVNEKAIRRPYGAARLSTLLTFAQSVYLMFSAVYVCKETIEHVLLSAGEGHHHHAGDESIGVGLELPLVLTSITFCSLLGSAILFDNNSGILNITQTRIPPLSVLLRTIRSFLLRSNSQDFHDTFSPRSRMTKALTNPFVLSPLVFCVGILVIGILVSGSHQRLIDLLFASLIAFITFNLAYRACVILGTVLLQTSPARARTSVKKGSEKTGGTEGQMEVFLSAMREVERHPHVHHLAPPHIWQIAPGSSNFMSSSSSNQASNNLVVTLELHVHAELGDEDVLELTRWAWERVVIGLGGSPPEKGPGPSERMMEGKGKWTDELKLEEADGGGPEVTVGIVRHRI